MIPKKIKIAHLVSHPIQYFAPLYRELSKRPEITLTVYFYSDATLHEYKDAGFGQSIQWDTDLLGGYEARICPSARKRKIGKGILQLPNWDILGEAISRHYDVVWIHGYAHPNAWLAAAKAYFIGSRVLLREEQTLLDARPWYKRLLKKIMLPGLFCISSGLYIGEENRRYFEHYGMRPARLFPAKYCVDNSYFGRRAVEAAADRRAVREGFGITDDSTVVLFCGKFVEKKQPLFLIKAFEQVRAKRLCWLLMVGSGPLKGEAENLVTQRNIPNVVMPGFLNQSELHKAYTAADVFVLPSSYQETWGLVVNEAMNFSLPVVVSDRVGCAADLVRDGWNGLVVAHREIGALAEAIDKLAGDATMRLRFGERSNALVADYSIEACADGIVAACQAITGGAKGGT